MEPKILKILNGFILVSSFLCQYVEGAASSSGPVAGKVYIALKSISPCPKKMQGENGLRLVNFHGHNPEGRPYEFIMSTDATLDFPIEDNNMMAALHLAQWTKRGGWRTGVRDIRFPQMCVAMTNFVKNVWDPLSVGIFGRKTGCPIPPVRNAKLRNITIDTRTPHVKEFVYGRWRADLVLEKFQDNKGLVSTTKACLRIISETIPAFSENP